jgi:hypothetical protein
MSIPINCNSTNNFGVAQLIVDATPGKGTHTSIANALLTAVSGQTVFIRPGTYTENPTLIAGVNLTAFDCDSVTPNVTILGTCTLNSGTVTCSGINFSSNGNYALQTPSSASSATLNLINCNILANGNDTAISNSNTTVPSYINLINCQGNITFTNAIFYSMTGTGIINFEYCNITNTGNGSIFSTCSNGQIVMIFCNIFFELHFTSSGTLQMSFCEVNTEAIQSSCIFYANVSNESYISNCSFYSTFAACLNTSGTLSVQNCSLLTNSTFAISGLGTLYYGLLSTSNTTLLGVNTLVPYVSSNDAIEVFSPVAYPFTVGAQTAFVPVDTSSARTVNLGSTPVSGQKHIIKDNTGTASTHNITLNGNGNNIDGSSTSLININYGSLTVVFNGTQWNII